MELHHESHNMAAANHGHHGQQHNSHLISHDHLEQPQQDGAEPMMMMMMKMYFHFGFGDTLLFQSLVINSAWKLWLTSGALFLAAVLLEAIDYSRGYLSCRCSERAGSQRHTSASSQAQLINSSARVRNQPDGEEQRWSCCSGSNGGPTLGSLTVEAHRASPASNNRKEAQYFPIRTGDSALVRAAQSGLHFVRTGLSLGLMLAAMTYNVCLILPILLGSGVGFYIFYRPALDSKSVMCH